jgi:hypothetical protein
MMALSTQIYTWSYLSHAQLLAHWSTHTPLSAILSSEMLWQTISQKIIEMVGYTPRISASVWPWYFNSNRARLTAASWGPLVNAEDKDWGAGWSRIRSSRCSRKNMTTMRHTRWEMGKEWEWRTDQKITDFIKILVRVQTNQALWSDDWC